MAASATAMWRRSGTISGTNLLIPALRERFVPNAFAVSSLYFIDIRASLRIVDLDVLRRGFHQLGVGPSGEHLSFHQENDLVVVLDGGDLLCHRDQGNAGIFFVNVLQ